VVAATTDCVFDNLNTYNTVGTEPCSATDQDQRYH
jgi:hypothetical protein